MFQTISIHFADVQTLDVISLNFWHILISLLNLVIIFLILKKFLFKPVKNLFAERQNAIDHQYAAAADAEQKANADRAAWEEKLLQANEEADGIISDATAIAKRRADEIVSDASKKADGILTRAKEDAALERKKATEGIKREIVDVSSAIAEKMLEREVNPDDHRALIDSFINSIGEDDD